MIQQLRSLALLLCITLFSFALLSSAHASTDMTPESRPNFEKKKLQIHGHSITVEIADTEAKREYGLMFLKSLPKNQGMLFIFDNAQELSFWMKNTIMPLSIGFFDETNALFNTQEMKAEVKGMAQLPIYPSHGLAKYALEMPPKWFHTNGIKSGDVFTFVGKP